jgi:hypothetical protein
MRKSKVIIPVFIFLLMPGLLSAETETETPDLPDVQEILDRAIETAKEQEKSGAESAYTYLMNVTSEKLDKKGLPKEVETRLYENILLPGGSFERLIEKDGRPLTEKEQQKEAKREKKYREKLAKGEDPDKDEDSMAFDEELIGRYDFTLEGIENMDGRPVYAISYQPKPGKLPARRRIDRALNKSRGILWIDRESYSLAGLEFELIESIRIWWGFIGSISKMSGKLHFQRIDEDVSFPSNFDFYIKGRMLFRSFHRNQQIRWSRIEKAPETDESPSG